MKKVHSWPQGWIQAIDSVPLQPILELCCDRRVLIENHRGVTVYEPQCIQVRVKFGEIAICGENLQICRMQAQQLVIQGHIGEIRVIRR